MGGKKLIVLTVGEVDSASMANKKVNALSAEVLQYAIMERSGGRVG
jgi:hypothetical protein